VNDRLGVEPMDFPTVALSPAPPAEAQIVRASRLAPRAWKKRRSMLAYESRPMFPAYE